MKYHYHVSPRHRKKFVRRAYVLITVVLLLIIVAGVAIWIDSELQKNRNQPNTTSQQTTGYFAPSTQIFNTQYFQFQTDSTWAEVPSESTDNKYVYRSRRGSLIEHALTIYINGAPAKLEATHVLPVKPKNNITELLPQTVSDHCRNAVDAMTLVREVEYEGVTFNCDVDGTLYNVIVGFKGGTSQLRMNRKEGGTATYTIYYSNVTANPGASQLFDILSSFQTR